MKKLIALLLATLFIVTIAAGCASDGGGSQVSDPTPPSETSTSEPAGTTEEPHTPSDEPVVLNFLTPGPGMQRDTIEVWEAFNEELQKHLPHITVNFTVATFEDYGDTFNLAMAAQEQFDIAWFGWMFSLGNEVERGSLIPLTDLVEDYGQDIIAFFGRDHMDAIKFRGDIWSIPSWQGMTRGRHGLFMPQELIDLAGGQAWLDEMQKIAYEMRLSDKPEEKERLWLGFEEYLESAKEADLLEMGYSVGLLEGHFLLAGAYNIHFLAYVNYYDDTFTVNDYYASDMMQMNYRTVAEWHKKGYFHPDIASLERTWPDWRANQTWRGDFIGMGADARDDKAASQASMQNGFETNVVFNKENLEFVVDRMGLTIPYTAQHPVEAMQFINFLYSDEGADAYNIFMYGLEGQHWDYNAEGVAILAEGTYADVSWNYGSWAWMWGSMMSALNTEDTSKEEMQSRRDSEKDAWRNPLSGFIFDTGPITTEFNMIQSVRNVYEGVLMRGYLEDGWEDYYNEFMDKMQEAGIEAYLAELQRQITAYVAETGVSW